MLRLYTEGHRNFSNSDLRGVTGNIISQEIKSLNLREIILRRSNLTAVVLCRSATLKVDLTGSDLSNCNLQGADLSTCKLDQCNFSNSDLRRANLSRSSCRVSDFMKANLQNIMIYNNDTDFTASNFTEANFRSTYLSGKFSHTKFCKSNLRKATFKSFYSQGADFLDADLRDIELPTPTTVDIRYSYYNQKTKFSPDFDPIEMGMELIEEITDLED
ncbi:pentapeptide repeat-containing protein [Nostoc sp. LEGE 06077]|uniref:pentapeptide repeat-containing protein n=1 Tax=Nostoc sp. LEGE 06077 TaxID=915325 RepID=UPI0018818123|nr:pentapeptide repeat-containing protein [Nostoc sp. LEGE 06077]MBE9206407.1 pentapeptide repeat-containing protein [Nostoc sp. LEGE 06077]